MKTENQKRILVVLNNKLNEIGIDLIVHLDQVTEKYVSIGKVDIDTKKIGLLSPVFVKIDLEVSVGYCEERNVADIILQYHWDHRRGSNGYSVYFEYRDEEWKLK